MHRRPLPAPSSASGVTEPVREDVISWTTYLVNMEGHHDALNAPVLMAECKRALFDMGPLKAPGE
ncbi:hypothetical protein A2U01_0116736, partial [Trifolium medium]|nr:hypothetical protein [Trifolium medium]